MTRRSLKRKRLLVFRKQGWLQCLIDAAGWGWQAHYAGWDGQFLFSLPWNISADRVRGNDGAELGDRQVPHQVRARDGGADDVAHDPHDERDEHGGDADEHRGDGLGQQHAPAVRDERERDEAGALAPLTGDREDCDDGEHDRHG